ncbi:ribosomal protein l2 [Cyclospora cayetanensis]|uniref:Ribosomal protein l2 n=1 Tax=Cyclospora cayetanensis TaxID=88456 RepID=A0A1D3CTQ7_9EIME|nr:ribosomal protein l2 [Cyclospora cayetanensis]
MPQPTRRSRKDIWGTVLRIEHDPSHSTGIGLLQHDDGVLSYVPVSAVTRPGDRIIAGEFAPIQPGCCLPLQRIPVGTIVYAIELKPGAGAQLARAAGAYATLLNKDATSATLRLPSGEVRLLPLRCWACVGQAMQPAQQGGPLGAPKPPPLGKAGASRWRGWRPAVRGKAMNAAKHPHGGGTSQKKIARPPVSAWGIQRTGYKTRPRAKPLGGIIRRKRSNKFMRLFGSAAL